MSTHNKTYFSVKFGTIIILIAFVLYMGFKTSDYVKHVQAQKARVEYQIDQNQ